MTDTGRQLYEATKEPVLPVAKFGGCPRCGSPNNKPHVVVEPTHVELVCENGDRWTWRPGQRPAPARPIPVANLSSLEGISTRSSSNTIASGSPTYAELPERQAGACDADDSDMTEREPPSGAVAHVCPNCGMDTKVTYEDRTVVDHCYFCHKFTSTLPFW